LKLNALFSSASNRHRRPPNRAQHVLRGDDRRNKRSVQAHESGRAPVETRVIGYLRGELRLGQRERRAEHRALVVIGFPDFAVKINDPNCPINREIDLRFESFWRAGALRSGGRNSDDDRRAVR